MATQLSLSANMATEIERLALVVHAQASQDGVILIKQNLKTRLKLCNTGRTAHKTHFGCIGLHASRNPIFEANPKGMQIKKGASQGLSLSFTSSTWDVSRLRHLHVGQARHCARQVHRGIRIQAPAKSGLASMTRAGEAECVALGCMGLVTPKRGRLQLTICVYIYMYIYMYIHMYTQVPKGPGTKRLTFWGHD